MGCDMAAPTTKRLDKPDRVFSSASQRALSLDYHEAPVFLVMNILMMTNTYSPHVGGVARSIEAFSTEYRQRGHSVLIIAPTFENMPESEHGVVRIPAIQHFNGSDFSVALPIPGMLTTEIARFDADVIHSHHPFLLGFTALRVAHAHQIPLVFTHHTKYEDYTHYIPGDSKALKRFVIALASNYANLCDHVFVPSESMASIVIERGVTAPVSVVPTGVKLARFKTANGSKFRESLGIPRDAFVIGHLGRLAKEKNLEIMAEAIVKFVKTYPRTADVHFLLAGDGPLRQEIEEMFASNDLSARFHATGVLGYTDVAHAFSAMDLYTFCSQSETQGMVLTEAMAAGVPVVAIDAPGVREVVRDRINGRLLPQEDVDEFAAAINDVRNVLNRDTLTRGARATAKEFSLEHCADKALRQYTQLVEQDARPRPTDYLSWASTLHYLEAELISIRELANAVGVAIETRS